MVRAMVLAGFYLFAIPVIGLLGIPWTLLTGDINFLYRTAMKAAFGGVRLIGIRVEVRGREELPTGGTFIFMCNHVSNLDPPIVVPMIPGRTSVLVKKEVFRIPILAWAMRLADFVRVDRSDREAAIASVQRAVAVMEKGVHMTAFPEGTRSSDGRLLPFKKGPFHMALESGYPIVPMTIFGTEEMMPKNDWRIRQGTATLVFHPPVNSRDFNTPEALSDAVRAAIREGLPERLRD